MRWLVILAAAACGRVGFDELPPVPLLDASARVYCETIPHLAAAPAIDGTLEPGLAVSRLEPVGWATSLVPPPTQPTDTNVQYAFGWFDGGLYVFVDVADAMVLPAASGEHAFCGDGVEVYVDSDGMFPNAPMYDVPGTRQFMAEAPDSAQPRTMGEIYAQQIPLGAWTAGYATFQTPTGYRLEAIIDSTALGISTWALASGASVGIDLAINVADGPVMPAGGCTTNFRLGQYFLRVVDMPLDWPFRNVGAFCTPVLE